MNSQPAEFSSRRARFLTLFVSLVVAIGIVLANFASEPVPADIGSKLGSGQTIERGLRLAARLVLAERRSGARQARPWMGS
jgi:hypothetical protein